MAASPQIERANADDLARAFAVREKERPDALTMLFDALTTIFTEVALRRDPDCPVCGENPTINEYIDYVEFCNPVRA